MKRAPLPRRAVLALLAAALGAAVYAAAALAAPVQGTIVGAIQSVSGTSFTVLTTLSPTGKSKVSVGAKTLIDEQQAATRADLMKGVCVTATGTKQGTAITASRVAVTPCFRPNGRRPAGPRRRPPNGANGNRRFAPPAGFAFANGAVTAVKGSSLTVKGRTGTQVVTLTGKTQITRTARVGASAVKAKLCAFVRGTSSDGGVTVQAEQVQLTPPVGGSCPAFRRRP